jgi:hypothetical protein
MESQLKRARLPEDFRTGRYALEPGKYPRAEPIEIYGHTDGSADFEFVLDSEAHRLPLSVVEHAAVEVGIAARAYIDPLNYAQGVALFLAALRKQSWTVLPPRPVPVPDPKRDMRYLGT